jgi:hypothetical protein
MALVTVRHGYVISRLMLIPYHTCSPPTGSEGATALASALEFQSSLYILHLDFNKIDFAGVRALGRSLLVNQR